MPPEVEPVADNAAEAAPSDENVPEPNATQDDSGADAPSSVEDLVSQFGDELFENDAVQERISTEVTKAQDRARSQLLAEQRRNFGNPEIVQNAMLGIMMDGGIEADGITRSMRDKANTLYVTAQTAAAELIAEQIPTTFLANYTYDAETMSEYQGRLASGNVDGAYDLLINTAVEQKSAERERDFDKRVKDEVEQQRKAELEANGTNGAVTPPSVSKGGRASNAPYVLTSTEIGRMPPSTWKRLPDDVKSAIKSNVDQADAERGGDAYDENRLLQLESATK